MSWKINNKITAHSHYFTSVALIQYIPLFCAVKVEKNNKVLVQAQDPTQSTMGSN